MHALGCMINVKRVAKVEKLGLCIKFDILIEFRFPFLRYKFFFGMNAEVLNLRFFGPVKSFGWF